MAVILILLTIVTFGSLNIDFGIDDNRKWYVVNDRVMGGRSFGDLETTKNSIKFSGEVSLENNGGFSSIRSPYQKTNLSDFSKVIIRYRATGRDFSFQLQKHEAWYLPNFKLLLPNTADKWEEVTFKIMDFKKYRVGRYTGESIGSEDLSSIIRMGIITEEKREGPFEIEVDYIRFQ